MSSTDDDRLIQVELEDVEKRIARAVKNGGLPTEAEAQNVFDELTRAHDALEDISLRVEGVAASCLGEDVPPVTLDQLGVLSVLLTDFDGRVHDLNELAGRVRASMSHLVAIRSQQQFAKSKSAAA